MFVEPDLIVHKREIITQEIIIVGVWDDKHWREYDYLVTLSIKEN